MSAAGRVPCPAWRAISTGCRRRASHASKATGRNGRKAMAMQLDNYSLLGRSGLRVSPLTLGAMTFGMTPGRWGSSDEEAAQMVDLYTARGGNFIDTANFYGNMGQSEVVLGKLIQSRRDSLVISTKYSLTTRPGDPNASGNHRK